MMSDWQSLTRAPRHPMALTGRLRANTRWRRLATEHFDVLIVGAGLSGIGAGFHLQQHCPDKSYAILEGRDSIGGTWDLFRYPGIRSDSRHVHARLFVRPWTEAKAIADGPLDPELRPRDRRRERHRQEHPLPSSGQARVVVVAGCALDGRSRTRAGEARELVRFTCNFLFMCSGYYNYEEGYTPDFAGSQRFRRPHRASAEMARRPRLRRQARGGDRQRRHRGDPGAGDGQDGRPCHHAAALADLCGVASRRRMRWPTSCARSCPPSSPTI